MLFCSPARQFNFSIQFKRLNFLKLIFILKIIKSKKVFDREFDQVYRTSKTNRAILSMIYNPVTDELLTSAVDGLKVNNIFNIDKNFFNRLKL